MALPKRSAKLDEMPAKRGRSTSAKWDEWADEIAALRKEKSGKVYVYNDVEKPAAIAQGLRKYFNINAGSRDVDAETKIGALVIQNLDLETDEEDTTYTDA